MPQAIVIAITLALSLLLTRPLALANAYFFVRPLLDPYADADLTLLYLPINWPIGLVIAVSVVPVGLVRARFRIVQYNTTPLYLLIFLAILSIAYSMNVITSVGQTVKYVNALALALLVSNAVKTREDVLRVYKGIVAASLVPMAYGYYQFLTDTGTRGLGGEADRAVSVFSFANLYGMFLAIVLLSALILYVADSGARARWGYAAVAVSAILSSIIALNRGTWIALTAGVLLAYPYYRRFVRLRWVIGPLLVVALVAGGVIIQRFLELEGRDTFSGRVSLWRLLLARAGDIPLLGHGAGTAPFVLERLAGTENVPHNDYLRLLFELGWLAPVLYAVLLFREFAWNVRSRHQADAWHVQFLTLVLIIYWVIISSVQNAVHDVTVFPLFLVCCHLARQYALLPAARA